MSTDIHELEQLTRTQSAVLRITVDRGVTRVSWKVRGRRAEVVTGFAHGTCPAAPAAGVLLELLRRLGLRDVPTTASLVEQMNPRQLERARKLIAQMNLLKAEVRNPIRARHIERSLGSPQSSLHPDVVQGEPE